MVCFIALGKGSGSLTVFGADPAGFTATDEALVSLFLLRARALEIRTVLGFGAEVNLDSIRDQSRDVSIYMIPTFFLRSGASSSLSVFLALVKLYFKPHGIRLRPNIAVTGVLSLSGYILRVADVIAKIKGALRYGAELVIVPSCSEGTIEGLLKEVEEAPQRAEQALREAEKAEEEAKTRELEVQEARLIGGEVAEVAGKNAEEARKMATEAHIKAAAAREWEMKAAQPDPDRLTRDEVVTHVRFVDTVVDVLECAIEGE